MEGHVAQLTFAGSLPQEHPLGAHFRDPVLRSHSRAGRLPSLAVPHPPLSPQGLSPGLSQGLAPVSPLGLKGGTPCALLGCILVPSHEPGWTMRQSAFQEHPPLTLPGCPSVSG